MLKTLLVYSHLLATCIALGTLLQADYRLWRWRRDWLDASKCAQLAEVQQVVGVALLALWATGLLLVVQGYLAEGVTYLLNQKLWAKGTVVVVLSLNGLLLHRIGFPMLLKAPFVALPGPARLRLGLFGALSMSSWLFAAFLGVARPWNHSVPYLHIMAGFATLLLLAVAVALAVARQVGSVEGAERTASC